MERLETMFLALFKTLRAANYINLSHVINKFAWLGIHFSININNLNI